MSFDAAALLEPISIAYEAFKRTKLTKDSTVDITARRHCHGAVALAKYYGAGQIVCVGRKEPKLAVAKDMGATHLVNNTKCSMPEEIKKNHRRQGEPISLSSLPLRKLPYRLHHVGQKGRSCGNSRIL